MFPNSDGTPAFELATLSDFSGAWRRNRFGTARGKEGDHVSRADALYF
jgi:hypothetical protein